LGVIVVVEDETNFSSMTQNNQFNFFLHVNGSFTH